MSPICLMRSKTRRLAPRRIDCVASSPARWALPASIIDRARSKQYATRSASRGTRPSYRRDWGPRTWPPVPYVRRARSAYERWVADDHFGLRTDRFDWLAALVVGQQRVHLLDGHQGLADGRRRLAETVVAQPLDVPDPHHGLRQLMGVEIDLDAVKLFRADLRNP